MILKSYNGPDHHMIPQECFIVIHLKICIKRTYIMSLLPSDAIWHPRYWPILFVTFSAAEGHFLNRLMSSLIHISHDAKCQRECKCHMHIENMYVSPISFPRRWNTARRSSYISAFCVYGIFPHALNSMLGLYSLSGKTSYCKISWSLEVARFGFRLFQSLWNLTGPSAAALPRCLSNFRAVR